MENQQIPKNEIFSSLTTKHILLLSAGAVALLLLLLLYAWLDVSGVFRPVPKVTVLAENRYAETIRVVTDIDYAPFSYVDEDGSYSGLDVELMNIIANRLQVNLDFTLLDWPVANQRLLDGEADILMNMETDLVADDPRLIATVPTTEKQYVIYGREKISFVAELYGRKVASLHALPELELDDEITYLDSYATIFEALKNGEYDFAVCPIQVGNSFLEKLEIQNVQPSYAVSHVYGTLALTAGNEALRDRLNPVLRDLAIEGVLDDLDEKWVNHRYENMSLRAIIEQHMWILAVVGLVWILLILLLTNMVVQRRQARLKDAYTRSLREHLETIEQQNVELEEQREALMEAKNQAEEGSRAKTTFLFNMSHDIRTPMNAIIGYTNLAKREKNIPETLLDYLKKIEAASQHLLSLINDVLEMSRIESNKMEMEVGDTDLCKIVTDAQDMFATQMQEKNIRFTVDTSRVKNKAVLCDRNRFNRALLNLLSNAWKFTPSGGSVTVTLEQTNDGEDGYGDYVLRVKDSGIGMTPEFADRVFEAFERERTSTVSGIQGTGLGMAITKGIVDMMGGSIAVETAPGQGTAFIIRVRFALAAEMADTSDLSSERAAGAPNFHQMRLLLVEDNEINREIATLLLEEAGFTLDEAVNGQEAVDKVTAAGPGYYNAILMDIQMPVMNGYEATKAIRALDNPTLAGIPIVAMTANAFSEDIQAAYDAGMNGHIAKPIDVEKMMETLSEVLGRNPTTIG